jgi:hypothetical protein
MAEDSTAKGLHKIGEDPPDTCQRDVLLAVCAKRGCPPACTLASPSSPIQLGLGVLAGGGDG